MCPTPQLERWSPCKVSRFIQDPGQGTASHIRSQKPARSGLGSLQGKHAMGGAFLDFLAGLA